MSTSGRAAQLLAVVMARSSDLHNPFSELGWGGGGGGRVRLGKEFLLPPLALSAGEAPRAKPTPGNQRYCTFAKRCLIPHLSFQLHLL